MDSYMKGMVEGAPSPRSSRFRRSERSLSSLNGRTATHLGVPQLVVL